MISKHDALHAIEARVEPVERGVHAVERTWDPQCLKAGERGQGGQDGRCLCPLHEPIVPTHSTLGKTA